MAAISFDTPLLAGDELLELIPQRPPIVMVDRFFGMDQNGSYTGLKVEASNSKKPTTAASQRNGTEFMVLPPYAPIIEYPPGGRSSVFCWNVAQKTK